MNRLGQDPDWIARQRAAADVVLDPVLFGPNAPPIADQLGLAPEDCASAQSALNAIGELVARDEMTIQQAALDREKIVTGLLTRLMPDLNIIGRDHRNRQGDLI